MSNLYNPMNNGYRINLSIIIFNAWNRFRADIWLYLGIGLAYFLINLIIGSIPFIGFLGNFSSTILFAGFFLYLKNKETGIHSNSDLWKGYLYIGDLMIYQIIVMLLIVPLIVISLSSIIPTNDFIGIITGNLNIVDFSNTLSDKLESIPPNVSLGLFLVFGLTIYLSISFMFTIPLIVNSKLGFWQAMELSRKTVGKNFFHFFLFWLLFIISMGFAVLMTFGLAFFFFNPFMYIIIYEMYNQIFIKQEE